MKQQTCGRDKEREKLATPHIESTAWEYHLEEDAETFWVRH